MDVHDPEFERYCGGNIIPRTTIILNNALNLKQRKSFRQTCFLEHLINSLSFLALISSRIDCSLATFALVPSYSFEQCYQREIYRDNHFSQGVLNVWSSTCTIGADQV